MTPPSAGLSQDGDERQGHGPAGARHRIELCRDTSCQAMGGDRLADHARKKLGCEFHSHSRDGVFALQPVDCLGLCTRSPGMLIDGIPYGQLTPRRFDKILDYIRKAAI